MAGTTQTATLVGSPEEETYIRVALRIPPRVWREACERAVFDEIPACEIFERGAKMYMAQPKEQTAPKH
jgi:hypothetical protein